jgi:hypothetical protein
VKKFTARTLSVLESKLPVGITRLTLAFENRDAVPKMKIFAHILRGAHGFNESSRFALLPNDTLPSSSKESINNLVDHRPTLDLLLQRVAAALVAAPDPLGNKVKTLTLKKLQG